MPESPFLIHVRCDRITSLTNPAADDIGFFRADMPQVPGVGELVSLAGELYIVMHRAWAIPAPDVSGYRAYASLRVLPCAYA